MTKSNAIATAVKRVNETGYMFWVVRRGYRYEAQIESHPMKRGWTVAEMIGPGNVRNFEAPEEA